MSLSVALVGAGNVSRVHLTALANSPTVRVVGLYDAVREQAARRAGEFGIERVYEQWEDLLADPRVDAVGVLLPHDLHHRYTVEALEAGKHVVCEKPMAASLAECDAMIAAARRTGRRLFIVQNRLYYRAYEVMYEHLREGAIGRVFLAQTTGFEGPETVGVRPWLGTARPGNGVLMAQAVHPVYTLRWLLGDVARVSALFGRQKIVDMAAEDTAIATLEFTAGVLAEMTATFGLRRGPFDHGIMLYGDDGYLEVHSRHGDPRRPHVLRMISPRVYGDTDLREIEVPPTTGPAEDFRRMWEDYARAIESGATARASDIDGRKAVEIVLAAHRSNETGRVVTLPLDS
ncbi:MAG: Gfo/Idh/MocA family oxidoreductase [Chloroflexi bacterium]|nr:Gfo/Idh/MocA family oxidoreductase [Chloroflexota bacterium]